MPENPASLSSFNQAVTSTSRNSDGTFGKGNKISNGRKPQARARLSEGVISRLAEDWEKHGPKAIEDMRRASPGEYVRVIASLLPKNVTMTQDASETFLDALKLMQAMRKPEAEIPHPDQTQSSKVVDVVDLDPETGQPIENKEN